jgi:hypothetical protein
VKIVIQILGLKTILKIIFKGDYCKCMHYLIIIFMMVIGALIGGVTNVIAVRMLFHPFKTYYIFGKRVPFTPGLDS